MYSKLGYSIENIVTITTLAVNVTAIIFNKLQGNIHFLKSKIENKY